MHPYAVTYHLVAQDQEGHIKSLLRGGTLHVAHQSQLLHWQHKHMVHHIVLAALGQHRVCVVVLMRALTHKRGSCRHEQVQ